jgi:hypothetical protein
MLFVEGDINVLEQGQILSIQLSVSTRLLALQLVVILFKAACPTNVSSLLAALRDDTTLGTGIGETVENRNRGR